MKNREQLSTGCRNVKKQQIYNSNITVVWNLMYVWVRVCLVTKSRPTLCDPTDCSPPGSNVHGILQLRILEWVAISFSSGSSWPIKPEPPELAGRFFNTEPPEKPLKPLSICYFSKTLSMIHLKSWWGPGRAFVPDGWLLLAGACICQQWEWSGWKNKYSLKGILYWLATTYPESPLSCEAFRWRDWQAGGCLWWD